jgi:hypothetical protein
MVEMRIIPTRWRLMTGGLDKGLIEQICYRKTSDCETMEVDSMNRAFIRRSYIATHKKLTGGDNAHIRFDDHWKRFLNSLRALRSLAGFAPKERLGIQALLSREANEEP